MYGAAYPKGHLLSSDIDLENRFLWIGFVRKGYW